MLTLLKPLRASQVALVVKNPPAKAGDLRDVGSVKIPWRRHGYHSSVLAWRISRTEKPGRLQSMGWQEVRHNWRYFSMQGHKPLNHRSVNCFLPSQVSRAFL